MQAKQSNIQIGAWIVVAVCTAVVIGLIIFLTWFKRPVEVTSFEECRAAGGSVMESYPERCLYNGKTYVNQEQRLPKEIGYVGLKEDEALLMAEKNKVPARVVERDGESLPVTMDFVPGRHNFFVRDGLVYKVDVENEGEDGPIIE